MKIYTVSDREFEKYGKVVKLDCNKLISAAEKIEYPDEGTSYVPKVEELQSQDISGVLCEDYFGELPIQVGYCFGHNNMLNALEWHKNSEINIAVTDFILLLGTLCDMDGDRFDSSKVKAFWVKKGEAVEVYATTLHFCPCQTSSSGFGCIVVLPEGTNLPLENSPNDKLLFRKNKWLICHEQNKTLLEKGVYGGLFGENFKM